MRATHRGGFRRGGEGGDVAPPFLSKLVLGQ